MSDENNNISVDGADSLGPVDVIANAADLSYRAAKSITTSAELLIDFGAGAVAAGNSLSSAMNYATQFIKRQRAWSIVLFGLAAFTTGNLIVGVVLVRNLSQVCGR